MEIKVIEDGTPFAIAIAGRLDTGTSPQLEEFAKSAYEGGKKDIVVDLSDCPFVSSAGLRVIVAMQKRAAASGSLVFKGVQPEVMEVFEMTGFDNILTIE